MDAAANQFVSTVAAAALGAFAAAAVSYRYALAKFRTERTFDKQLAWYEKATGVFIGVANRLNWALAADVAGVDASERNRAWAEAQNALVSLRGLEAEAEMYASPASYEAISEAIADIVTLSRSIWHFKSTPATTEGAARAPKLYEVMHKMLYHAASRLATDAREHLRLPALSREWRLYDREFRELQHQLDDLKKAGLNFRYGSADRDVPEERASADLSNRGSA